MTMWNVRVRRASGPVHLGQVSANTEGEARCAALYRFGLSEDELRAGEGDALRGILPLEDFDVTPAR